MKLIRLRLSNAKSYPEDSPPVDFEDGLNFLSGANGAGKTTIMESIGFALFDVEPCRPIADFIHRGAKSGEIRVRVLADDGRIYEVVRRFGARASWIVYGDDGLALHEKDADVRRFLADLMRLREANQLENVWRNIIGVPQGQYTAVFKMTDSQRKAIFDPVIAVEGYRRVSDGSLAAIKNRRLPLEIKERESAMARADDYLAGPAPDVENARRELDALTQRVTASAGEQSRLAQLLSSLDATRQKIDRLEADIESRRARRKSLDAEIAASETALAGEAAVHALAAQHEARRAALALVDKECHSLSAAIDVENENRRSLRSSVCPFLKEDCDRVTPAVFERRIAALQARLDEARPRRDSAAAAERESAQAVARAHEFSERRRRLDQARADRAALGIEQREADSAALAALYNAEGHAQTKELHARAIAESSALRRDRENAERELRRLEDVAAQRERRAVEREEARRGKDRLERFAGVVEDAWRILRELGPRVSARLLETISARASALFASLQRAPATLRWTGAYEVTAAMPDGERPFRTLSGGEQMCAALAIQMAMARDFAGASFCVFDEPTVHLDSGRRERLADAIRDARREAGFRQVLLASQDDAFESRVDHVIPIVRDEKGSRVGTVVA